MEFFRKGGGGSRPYPLLSGTFLRLKSYGIFYENRGIWLLLGTFPKRFILDIAILGVLGKFVFSLFVTEIEMCLTGFITSKNKGGGRELV